MENYSTNNMKNININFETLSPINKRQNCAKIDLNNINNLYDKKNIMLQNKLFSLIIKFHSIFKKLIADINSVLITLGNQTISSKSLLLKINQDDERISSLNDRLEMINDTKNLLDNNLLIANNNLNMFISEVQKNFKEFKELISEKDKKIHHYHSINNSKVLKQNIKSKSVPKENLDENYILFNSKNNKNNKKINKENKIDFMTLNNKRDQMEDNFMSTPKQNFFNYIKPNNIYLNFNPNENISNNFENYYQRPNSNFYPHKNIIQEKKHRNKSQEIFDDKLTSRAEKVNKSQSNYNNLANEKMKYPNKMKKRNCFINNKFINVSTANKKLNNKYLTNWNQDFRKMNYRDKLLFKQINQDSN